MNNFHLAAIEDNEIRAVVLLKPMEDNIVKMRQFAVDSKYQNQGIGQKLTKLAEQFAGEKNYKKIVLHARKSAVGFYLNMNYTLISKEFLEVGLPHYEMEKILEK
jgi:predicted GNAT family N-acyltransferase